MNVFRLVLCLAGLAAYLVAKQWFQPIAAPASLPGSNPSAAPAAEARQVVPHSPHGAQDTEVLKAEQALVKAGQ